MEFRSADAGDVDDIVALVESAYRGESSRTGWTTEADLLEGRRTDRGGVLEVLPHVLLATEAGQLRGCCTLVPGDGHASFGMFAVHPGGQGAGTGSLLLAEAERRATEQGLASVEMKVLSVRDELIAFYQRRGYRPTGEERPFPYGQERFGRPTRDDLVFSVLAKPLA